MAIDLGTTNLVKHYFNICNTALLQQENKLIYKVAIEIVNRVASGENITVDVVAEDGAPLGRYTTYFKDGQFGPIREGEHEPDAHFRLSRPFLAQVLENADTYIRHPEKLDWSWLIP